MNARFLFFRRLLALLCLGSSLVLFAALCAGEEVSIATIPWGDPQFTDGASNTHPQPAWLLAAGMDGGLWIANDTWYGWQPALGDWQPDLSTNRLLIQLDRAVVSNNLWIAVTASREPDAGILAGLYDNDLQVVSDPIQLFAASTTTYTNSIDLSQLPSASILSLSATNGMLRIFNTVLCRSGATSPTVSPPSDRPTVSPSSVCSRPSDFPTVRPSSVIRPQVSGATHTWYVNAAAGSDTYDGTTETCTSATTGPKQTIPAAVLPAVAGDTVYVAAGNYGKTIIISNVRMITKGRVVLQ